MKIMQKGNYIINDALNRRLISILEEVRSAGFEQYIVSDKHQSIIDNIMKYLITGHQKDSNEVWVMTIMIVLTITIIGSSSLTNVLAKGKVTM